MMFFTLILLTSCTPAFRQATPDEASLSLSGSELALEVWTPFHAASVGVRSASVQSGYCVPASCLPDAEGRVLLVLPQMGALYPTRVVLGQIEGFEKARAVVNVPDSEDDLLAELER